MEPNRSRISEFERTQKPWTRLEASIGTFERLGSQVESALARKPWVSVFVLALVFLACSSMKARRSQLWLDEILTEYIAALPSFDAIWKALMAHAESSPPLFHLVSRWSGLTLGWTPLGLRFPAIAGYLTMTLCAYFIARRYVGPLYALVGALSGYLTYAPFYATRARPYGLLLGLSCIALVCWQQVCRGRGRRLALLGLCLSLATALGMQWYAVLSFAAIGFGELVRIWRSRRVDWLVWLALGFATTPLFFFLPLIRANRMLAQGNFSPATLPHFVESTLSFYLPKDGVLWAVFVLMGFVWILFLGRGEQQPDTSIEPPPVHEVAAWVALLFAPLEALIIGRLVTGVFHHRYAIVTIIGFSILLPFCLRHLFRNSRAAALTALLFLVVCFAGWYAFREQAEEQAENITTGLAPWLQTADASRLPIVVADPMTYLPLAHNAGKDLRDVLVYIPDSKEALRYTGVNTADYNLTGLRSIAPLNLPTYSSFASSHQRFLVLWEDSRLDWIVPKLRDTGAELRLCNAFGPRLLFLADFPAIAARTGDGGPNLATDVACKEKR